jgi:hypothetical protein
MAITVYELGPLFDPVLVEVAGLRARLQVKQAALTEWMKTAGAHMGLLVALDDVPVAIERTSGSTAIVTLSLRDLEFADNVVFLDWLKAARNNLVHGG